VPIADILGDVPACLLEHPGTPFGGPHAAVALAAAGDGIGIERLRRYAAGHPDPTFPGVVAPLCTGLAALVAGDPERAVQPLAAVAGQVGRLGGSPAQQEVVVETLIHALIASGRTVAACRLISERLDRRPAPVDRRRLWQLSQRSLTRGR
jgi:hypothetical protein